MIRAFVFITLVMMVLLRCNEKPGVAKANVLPEINDSRGRQDFKVYNDFRSDNFVVVFHSPRAGKAAVSVYYADGKLFSRRDFAVKRGVNTWDYRQKFSSTGIYIVSLLMDDTERTCKIYKTIS